MEEFKFYCKELKEVNEITEKYKMIVLLIEERKQEYHDFFLTIFVCSFIIFFNYMLMTTIDNETKRAAALTLSIIISGLLGIFYFFVKGFDDIKYYFSSQSKNQALLNLGKDSYYTLLFYIKNYNKRLNALKNLHDKISTREYLESVIEKSKSLNKEELILLRNLVENDNKERKKYFETIEEKENIELMVV